MTDVRLDQRRILIDERPALVVAGEVHYFRLLRESWSQRLDLLREAGADTVATYIPWCVHERADGSIDLTGRTDATLDLGAFIDLAAERGLRVLLRPGPFIMAEMAGEGVPDRVRREHPEILPRGWDGKPGLTADVDVLAPAFLREARGWYQAVGNVARPRMAGNGGPVIAVQVDNEIGMLAWVSNTPQFTPRSFAALNAWLDNRYGNDLAQRYPGLDPDPERRDLPGLLSPPAQQWATALRLDLGRFSRDQFAQYVDELVHVAQNAGLSGVPFLINIHGTSDGSGATFPIGLSQLATAFSGRPGMAAGSDHYLGEMTLRTAADLHLMNAYLQAASAPEQPITSLEFEAGHADYGDDLAHAVDPSSVVLKTRLSLAQGHRLLNYYLFAGGTNFVADPPRTDGTTRFAITGQRHGFAAPVDPEGQRGPTFEATAHAMELNSRLAPWIADSHEEHDDLALGMVLDNYLTEYRPPSVADAAAVSELAYARGGGPRGILPRVLLTLGYRYGAVDLLGGSPLPHVIVLGSPVAADAAVQQRLAHHVEQGHSLLLLGSVPTMELDGTPCTVLADALGITVLGELRDGPGWFTSVNSRWGRGTERRVGRLQTYDAPRAEVILTEAISGTPCGVLASAGSGRAVVLGCDFGADLALFRTALERLGVAPGLVHEVVPGLIATTTSSADGSRILHAINVSGSPITTPFTLDGAPLFAGVAITLLPRSGVALPIGIGVAGHQFTATAEIELVNSATIHLTGQGRAWLDGVEVPVRDNRVELPDLP